MLWLKIGSNRPKSAQTVISHSLKSYLSRIYCITPLLWAYIIQLIIMPTGSVMLHNLHALQRDRMHQRCIKVASLKVRSEAYTMQLGCINDASTLHPRCIHVAFTLHPRCINDASLYVYASCNQAATKLQHWVDGACIEAAPSMRDIFG